MPGFMIIVLPLVETQRSRVKVRSARVIVLMSYGTSETLVEIWQSTPVLTAASRLYSPWSTAAGRRYS